MTMSRLIYGLAGLVRLVLAAPYDPKEASWNININQTATSPLDYYAEWPNHQYHPSPDNWRFPFYSMFLDRWKDGDPTNNEANGTTWEFDIHETQFRAGGDAVGLLQSLDYLQSMGIQGIYVIGTLFQNFPWAYDGYSVADFTLLEKHAGTIDDWRKLIDAIHKRNMYIILDMTVGTMADYIGFLSRKDGTSYLNITAPFDTEGYNLLYKDGVRHNQVYLDFTLSNKTVPCSKIPEYHTDEGLVVHNVTKITCFDDDFDHYGDVEAFGVHPQWNRQLSKFASVQDRLQEWKPSVSKKLTHFGCMMIDALDPDGFRIDKATQMSAVFLGDWAEAMRACAQRRGKKNFFVPGEITGGNRLSSTFVGRGRTAPMYPADVTEAMSSVSTSGGYIRQSSKSALDSSAWSYVMYRWFEHFFGLAGRISASYDVDYVSLTNANNEIFRTNDLINVNTGKLDPRHMYGMTNHDIFRWPAIKDGLAKSYLGTALMHLLLPGVPLLYQGEEQDQKLLDNTASNYIFGRQPMFSTVAWQTHGCYAVGTSQYTANMSFAPAAKACHDDLTSLDYFNPASPGRAMLKQLHHLRAQYRTIQEAFAIQVNGNYSLKNVTLDNGQHWLQGLWSTVRFPDRLSQDFGSAEGNQTIWYLYNNKPYPQNYSEWQCSQDKVDWNVPYPNLLAPYDDTTTIRNLLPPYEERVLATSKVSYYNNGKAPHYGCLDSVNMEPFSLKVYVDKKYWKPPIPTVLAVTPYHDQRIVSNSSSVAESVPFAMQFSEELDCNDVTQKLSISSETAGKGSAKFSSLSCSKITSLAQSKFAWAVPSARWQIAGAITNIYPGIHWIDLQGGYTGIASKVASFDGAERFLFRVGKRDNPMIFPRLANYSSTLVGNVANNRVTLHHKAVGATRYRYTTNWRSSWSRWLTLENDTTTVDLLPWTGKSSQAWKGVHVMCQYWNPVVASAHHYQEGSSDHVPKRWPHLWAQGVFNRYLYDSALNSKFEYTGEVPGKNYTWKFDFMAEWPTNLSVNVWGLNPDEEPDAQYLYGDVDGDFVLDRVPPSLVQTDNVIQFKNAPQAPHLSYQIQIDDRTHRYWYVPRGQSSVSVIIYLWLVFAPVSFGILAMFLYAGAFNKVKWNSVGVKSQGGGWYRLRNLQSNVEYAEGAASSNIAATALKNGIRRKVLIATLEYDIQDLGIKIKIGGLGSMAQLMGTTLKHHDLIWIVPMVGDVNYPIHVLKHGEPLEVEIHGSSYGVESYYHILDNITYILLSSPIFSKQTKADPYPPRMDDLESAVFYSTWNQCIAKTCKRFPIDLYHINDYHGALAPIYLLPKVLPVALSLHNAEFQGLWPLRKAEEKKEVCGIYNITEELCTKYVQFGNVFNLLHAGVTFIRLHQAGFGAVGVSDKYGARSLARYPIFWALKEIGKLPNPDPSDTGAIDDEKNKNGKIMIDLEAEAKHKVMKREAQEWANLKVDPDAQLLVFVGRWTVQKGIDLIADLAPTLLEEFNVQLITIGPTVDLHGQFAAEKLAVLMEKYPGRVCSKPVFTACPPAVFGGADFALIPSRDEPFGLVAVEFGRKGALSIGCKTGGLGGMPGWWYTMNSASAAHLLSQFEAACRSALKSSEKTRALLRARAAKQRFPVAVWVKKLDSLQARCIYLSHKHNKNKQLSKPNMEPVMDDYEEAVDLRPAMPLEPLSMEAFQRKPSVLRRPIARERYVNQVPYAVEEEPEEDEYPRHGAQDLRRNMSLGSRRGPGARHRKLESLEEEEQYYETHSSASYSDDADETLYLQDEYEGNAPEERDFESYMGQWSRGTPRDLVVDSRHASVQSFDMNAFQQEDHRPGWPVRAYGNSDYAESSTNSSVFNYGEDGGFSQPGQLHSRYDHVRQPSQTHRRPAFADYEDDGVYDNRSDGFYEEDGRPPNFPYFANAGETGSRLSVLTLTDLEKDNGLQQSTIKKGEAMFTDSDGSARRAFKEALMKGITPSSSKKKHCIETFLIEAEREFFKQKKSQQIHGRKNKLTVIDGDEDDFDPNDRLRGMKRVMAMRLGWPLYAIVITIGQVLAANSYQLTLLAGTYNTSLQTYVINTVFAFASVGWYILYRRLPAYWVLSLPFVLYSVAFLLVGLPHISAIGSIMTARQITIFASYIYAAASASGSLYFALNFGAEGGIEVEGWVARACLVQGFQQAWSAPMWYWGDRLNDKKSNIAMLYRSGVPMSVSAAVWALSFLFLAAFFAMFFGLPRYYRQNPGVIPAFYRSLYRRKIIVWFLVCQVLSNFWLALPYGRSWTYLWNSPNLQTWAVVILCFFFFGVIWVLLLVIIRYYTKTHTWAPVIFALGVVAPRYFAEFWAVSTIGFYLPWARTPTASAVLGRALWLWLTVLDSLQSAGIGIMLLQTLIRDHVAFCLIVAQILGSISTIMAKALDLPFSSYLINFSAWEPSDGAGPLASPAFWICLACQVAIPAGYFLLFRKSQLAF